MKTVCATLKSQCSIVIFAKIAKNWPNFSFLAIILVPDQKNPNFLDFLDPYTCLDLGQEESQKVWSTLVITLVATLVPSVLKLLIGINIFKNSNILELSLISQKSNCY